MAANIITNRYGFPPGYRTAVFKPYSVWNGFVGSLNGPGATFQGAVISITASAAPADLSLLDITGPDGKLYTFQFVYAASALTHGIKIPLPASGASTAAQVMTAINGVVGLASGVDFGGATVIYPWVRQGVSAVVSLLNFTSGGPVTSFSAPAGIGIAAVSQGGFTSIGVAPAKVGRGFGFLPNQYTT